MNKKFYELPEEKQLRIINAGFQVFSQKEDVFEQMNKNMQDATAGIFTQYFKTVDLSKFKDDVKPLEILQMLTGMTDGYLHEQQRNNVPLDMTELMKKYREWAKMLKQISYKEEFLI